MNEKTQKIIDQRNEIREELIWSGQPLVGDYVKYADGTYKRFTHDWGPDYGIQVTNYFGNGGSFYLCSNGFASYSGGLDRAIPYEKLKMTDERKQESSGYFAMISTWLITELTLCWSVMCGHTKMNNIITQLKTAKDNDKHLLIIDALVEAGIPFIEDGLVYSLKKTRFDSCIFFARTQVLQTKQGNNVVTAKIGHWQDLIDILRG